MTTATDKTDVLLENHGTVCLITPLTEMARRWVAENVQLEGWQWLGQSFAAEPRHVADLVAGMKNDGLTVE